MSLNNPTVVLINPSPHDFAAYDFWAKPVGLLAIADHLRKSGINVKLIDATDPFHPQLAGLPAPKRRRFGAGKFYEEEISKPAALKNIRRKYHRYGLPPQRLKAAMIEVGHADAALVTCAMTYWYPGAFEAIEMAREVWPRTPIILGGTYATLCADHAREKSGADVVITGAWEHSISGFNKATGLSVPHPQQGALFCPALDLYPRLEYAPLMLSRGCPLRCAYCASGNLYGRYDLRPPAAVVEEIERALSRGIEDFAFYDDALLWKPEEGIIPLLELVISRGLNVRFHTPNGLHFSRIDRRLAALMRRAGFATIRLGVESLSMEKHIEWGGKAEPEKLGQVAAALLDAGYSRNELGAYLLAGLPDQSAWELEKDIASVISLGIRPYLTEYSPLPGTAMFARACEVSKYDLEHEPLTHNNSILACDGPDFTTDDLQRLKELTWPSAIKS